MIPIIALICCFALVLAGCSTTTLDGISLSSNWYSYTIYKGIQPYFVEGNEDYVDYFSKESLVYDVTFEPHETPGANYTMSYAEEDGKAGTYRTEFYALYIDANTSDLILDDYRDDYVAGEDISIRDKSTGVITAYCYKTSLEMNPVTFTYEGESETFEGDKAVTESYFLSCTDSLRPIYTRQDIQGHAPAEYTVKSLEGASAASDREYATYYSEDASEVTTVLTIRDGDDEYEGGESESFSSETDTGIIFDMTYLEMAVRAMGNLGEGLAQLVELYVPSAAETSKNAPVMSYYLYGSDYSGESDDLGDDGESITAAMAKAGLFADDSTEDETAVIDATSVEVIYSGNMNGLAQTYWYASVSDQTYNVGRSTLLKISSPVAFYLGDLIYSLSEVESTIWDGSRADIEVLRAEA